jgi:translation initiation factor IF-2
MRESGIARKIQEKTAPPEPVEEAPPVEQTEIPPPPVEAKKAPAPESEKPKPSRKSATKEVERASKAGPPAAAGQPAPEATSPPGEKDAKPKRGKGRKAKPVEIIEDSKERATSAQERKVLASILGHKKGRKEKYKRTKKERFAAAEEGRREQRERDRTTLRVHEATSAADVAHGLGVSPGEIVKILLDLGRIVTVNQRLDPECIDIIAEEFGFEVERTSLMDVNPFEELEEEDRPEDLAPRPPVVTIMGHVDHGKTKLMDAIRTADVASTEAGGITQHIGAYYVHLEPTDLCFIDTPGHEAFTAMRARGAMVTDVVVLVVAADDGVMPQTREAIAHARAAEVPILVAINKIDLPGADIERTKQELATEGLVPEEWGGNTPIALISALKKEGIEQLLELIHLQAELLEIQANPNKLAKGTIIEARLEQGQGAVATALIEEGTLHIGDPIVVGVYSGKVRALINEHGQRVDNAGPGVPVAVLGLSGTPIAGDELHGVPDERTAREFSEKMQQIRREREMAQVAHISLENLFEKIEDGAVKDLRVVVKGDVDGSVGAVCESLERIESEKIGVRILHRGVGAVSTSDIMLASASDAIVLGFGVTVPPDVASVADREGVDIRTYSIIYDAVEDIKKAMEGLLEAEEKEQLLGRLEVLEIFRSTKAGLIFGGEVKSGKLVRGADARVIRDGRIVFGGKLTSLRRFKDEAKEVTEGLECGVSIENFKDLHKADIIECYRIEKVAATL